MLLFQRAIPYFAFLTNEARIYLVPDYLSTSVQYPHQIISAVCELDDESDQVLLILLAASPCIHGFASS